MTSYCMESLVFVPREAPLPQALYFLGIQAAGSRHTLHTDKSGLDVEPPSEGRVGAGGLLVETLAHCLDLSFAGGSSGDSGIGWM